MWVRLMGIAQIRQNEIWPAIEYLKQLIRTCGETAIRTFYGRRSVIICFNTDWFVRNLAVSNPLNFNFIKLMKKVIRYKKYSTMNIITSFLTKKKIRTVLLQSVFHILTIKINFFSSNTLFTTGYHWESQWSSQILSFSNQIKILFSCNQYQFHELNADF